MAFACAQPTHTDIGEHAACCAYPVVVAFGHSIQPSLLKSLIMHGAIFKPDVIGGCRDGLFYLEVWAEDLFRRRLCGLQQYLTSYPLPWTAPGVATYKCMAACMTGATT